MQGFQELAKRVAEAVARSHSDSKSWCWAWIEERREEYQIASGFGRAISSYCGVISKRFWLAGMTGQSYLHELVFHRPSTDELYWLCSGLIVRLHSGQCERHWALDGVLYQAEFNMSTRSTVRIPVCMCWSSMSLSACTISDTNHAGASTMTLISVVMG